MYPTIKLLHIDLFIQIETHLSYIDAMKKETENYSLYAIYTNIQPKYRALHSLIFIYKYLMEIYLRK